MVVFGCSVRNIVKIVQELQTPQTILNKRIKTNVIFDQLDCMWNPHSRLPRYCYNDCYNRKKVIYRELKKWKQQQVEEQ